MARNSRPFCIGRCACGAISVVVGGEHRHYSDFAAAMIAADIFKRPGAGNDEQALAVEFLDLLATTERRADA